MKINLGNDSVISKLQEEFNQVFPYLRIEFIVTSNNTSGETVRRYFLRDKTKTLGEYRKVNHTGNFLIHPFMTVAELEKNFQDLYGMQILVLRKSGKVWLEITVSGNWTLEEQNAQGKSLSGIENSDHFSGN